MLIRTVIGVLLVLAALGAGAVLLGVLVVGRARWLRISRRPQAAIALLACLVVLVIGAVLLPTPEPKVGTQTQAVTAATSDASVAPSPSPAAAGIPVAQPAVAQPQPGSTAALLATLAVKGRAPKTGYDRDLFGAEWAQAGDGCSVRIAVLRRDVAGVRAGPEPCTVLGGTLADPYTGTAVLTDSIDVDHVVALSNAWQTGAGQWPADKRYAFANDPLNLLAVSASANRQKGDGDAATWLPAAKGYRCAYVSRQTAVKAKYGLWATEPERAAIERVLRDCPAEQPPAPGPAPTSRAVPAGKATPAPPAPVAPKPSLKPKAPQPPVVPAPKPSPKLKPPVVPPPPPPAVVDQPADVSFANCTEAKAAGYSNIPRSSPVYRKKFDRDGDGIGCES